MTEKRPVGRPREYDDPFHIEARRKAKENRQRKKERDTPKLPLA